MRTLPGLLALRRQTMAQRGPVGQFTRMGGFFHIDAPSVAK